MLNSVYVPGWDPLEKRGCPWGWVWAKAGTILSQPVTKFAMGSALAVVFGCATRLPLQRLIC